MYPALLANVTRADTTESQHYGHVAVVNGEGELVLALGDPHYVTFTRSAAKPFQAMPLLADNLPTHFGFDQEQVAVMMASHSGEARHVAAVERILQKIGCTAADLQCGVHQPLGEAVAKELAKSGQRPTVLQHNCSGKHAGMLAACVKNGWPLATYLQFDHPHQQRILKTFVEWFDLPNDEIKLGIDGCSAPNFAIPISALARAFAKLMSSHDEVARAVVPAFMAHPEMIAGEKRFDTEIMRCRRGTILAKTGAEGIQCIAGNWPEPLGIVIKVVDGSQRAVPAIAIEVLRRLQIADNELLKQLSHYRRIIRHNHRKLSIGWIEALPMVENGL